MGYQDKWLMSIISEDTINGNVSPLFREKGVQHRLGQTISIRETSLEERRLGFFTGCSSHKEITIENVGGDSPPTKKRIQKSSDIDTMFPARIHDNNTHFPTVSGSARCKLCYFKTGYDRRTTIFCTQCGVHLCLTKDRNCFKNFHIIDINSSSVISSSRDECSFVCFVKEPKGQNIINGGVCEPISTFELL